LWAEVKEEKEFALSAKRLAEFVRELPELPVKLSIEKDAVVQLYVGKISATFPLIDMEDFPTLPQVPEETILLSREGFLDAVEKVYFSIATDSVSTALMGMLFKKEGEKVYFVSTDGHRLSVVEKVFEGVQEVNFEVIIPRKGVQEIKKILEKKIEEDTVMVGFSDNHFYMRVGNVDFFSRILDAKFPNYERVIPQDYSRSFTINSSDLIKATKRVSLFSDDKIKGVKIEYLPGEGKVVLTSVKSSESTFTGSAKEELEVLEAEGDSLTFGLNSKYLIEALNAFESSEIRFYLGDSLWPIKLEAQPSEGYIHVIMPITLEE